MCNENSDENWICSSCIGEPFLRELITKTGTHHLCNYCDQTEACFSLEVVAVMTETAMRDHFERTPDTPSDWEVQLQRHSEYEWYRKGEEIHIVIENLLMIGPALAHDIQSLLEYRNSDFDSMVMGEECEFDSESHYAERSDADTSDLELMWTLFVNSLKTESRYINASVVATLDGIFDGIEDMQGPVGCPVILTAGPGSSLTSLYRARYSTGHSNLEAMLILPDKELGPPPHRLSGANRMSARGISVFYGASSVDTAISEIRPPVGSHVVSACFSILRPLRLLNLPALEYLWMKGSMFDPGFIKKRQQIAFLRRLIDRIVIPVLPGDEDFDYLPTQVIAEYLADDGRLALDGMLYPSVQQSGESSPENYNVVLFHKASRVHYLPLPSGKDCQVSYGYQTAENEWEMDICVTQNAESNPQAVSQSNVDDHSLPVDSRAPALQIDLSTVTVHKIRAARFEYGSDVVTRYKWISDSAANQDSPDNPDDDDFSI